MTLRVVGQDVKYIEVRKKLTINNIKAIIKREMNYKNDYLTITHKGRELIGSKQLADSGIEEGEAIEIK